MGIVNIAVIGAGAMGSLFGGRLAQAGHQVALVDVSSSILEAISEDGLIIDDDSGRQAVRLRACRAEELEGPADLVMLFTKTTHSRAAMGSAAHLIGPETRVLSLQNGLGNVELLNCFVPVDRILVGVTRMSGDSLAPGHVRTQGGGLTKIGRASMGFASGKASEADPWLADVVAKMAEAGLEVEAAPDVFVSIWEKVAFNAAINSTTAVCRATCGALGTVEGRELAFDVAREAVMVARACGVAASEKAVLDNLVNAFDVHRDHLTSMAQDVLAKRPTEIGAINGQIVQKAREKGLRVPCTEVLYRLVRIIEDGYLKI